MNDRLKSALPGPVITALQRLRSAGRALVDPFASSYYSQEGEDVVLRRILERQSAGFYVDVGAHHPQRFSNTYLFYRQGWRGINIEPNPTAMKLFRRVRRHDINLSVGVAEQEGELTYFMFNEPALNTFSEAQASQMATQSGYKIVKKIRVAVRRLDQLLQENLPEAQTIDFLSVDVEGFDLNVLMSNDWQRYRPHYVVVEAYNLSFSTVAQSPTDIFLTREGYELFAKTANTLIYVDRSSGAM